MNKNFIKVHQTPFRARYKLEILKEKFIDEEILKAYFKEFEEIKNIALIYNNQIFKAGKKEDILTSENLSTIFDTKIVLNKKNERYFIEEIL